MEKKSPSLTDIYENLIKQYGLEKKNVFSLREKEKLSKNDICKIASYLFRNISSKDTVEEILESKKKTWLKYIDYFQKVFNIELSKEIPLITALLCACFILMLDNQYFLIEDEKRQDFVKRIVKCADEEKFVDLSYDDKNALLTYIESVFESSIEEFGVEIRPFRQKKEDGTEHIKLYIYIKNKKRFRSNQLAIEMLAEMETYNKELYSLTSCMRYNIALEEIATEFEECIRERFNDNADSFFQGLSNKLKRKKNELFDDIENLKHYTEDRMEEEIINIFDEYVSKEFESFKKNWISECKTFNFNPCRLIGL